jgi:hypothetical protein
MLCELYHRCVALLLYIRHCKNLSYILPESVLCNCGSPSSSYFLRILPHNRNRASIGCPGPKQYYAIKALLKQTHITVKRTCSRNCCYTVEGLNNPKLLSPRMSLWSAVESLSHSVHRPCLCFGLGSRPSCPS